MENKTLNIALVVLVGILAGIAALFSISAVVQSSMAPYMANIAELKQGQAKIMKQIAPETADVEALVARINSLESKVRSLESKPRVKVPEKPAGPPPEDYTTKHDIPIDGDYVYGDKDAPVTIVGFKDFECPFCARFHEPFVEAVDKNPGKVNYVIKNFPLRFHRNALPAAKVALAAGEQGKYYEMADMLLDNFRDLGPEKYEELAEALGLNMKQFKKDLENKDAEYEALIKKDMELGAKVNVRGTPTYYINGRKTRARSLPQIEQAIEQAYQEVK